VPDAPRPPINEVVFSVGLARQVALSGPQLPAILGKWFSEHPRVETAPPYEIPPEPAELIGAFQAPSLQLITQQIPRYWLISPDDQELVQVQPDYLALNWRFRNEANHYPGYREMKRRFSDLLETTRAGLSLHQGTFKPARAELTYINVIRPGALWSSHEDTHKLINAVLPSGAVYEQLSFAYSRQLATRSDKFTGRLHVTVTPVVDWIKREPQLNINFTARSADFKNADVEPILAFMDLAHSEIEDSFKRLFSEEARSAWGLK
jgi:uncharacterized protein (TIGR04255 family)